MEIEIPDVAPGTSSVQEMMATLVLAACGEQWAVVVLALLAPFLLGRRLVSPT